MPPRIGYMVETFPSPSETFIANEIRCAVECGADVTVLALRRGTGGGSAPAEVVYALPEAQGGGRGGIAATLSGALDAFRREGPLPSRLMGGLGRMAVARGFAGEVARRGITHLHAHFASLPTTLALMVARLEPVSVSFAAHARDIYVQNRGLAGKLHRAQLCIACTDAAACILRSLAPADERTKVVRVYHGTDLERFAFAPHARPADPPRIVAVGRFVPKKGFETLIRACAALRKEHDVVCEIVGDGPLARKLNALVRDLGFEGAVSFPGWAAYETMPQVYARADVVVAPSVEAKDGDRDGLPNVIVEAMAAGVPVVASDISGIPEAVRDGQTGLLCPPGDESALADAMGRILRDADLRRRVTAGARQLAEEQFDCRRNARRVYELLQQAAQETAR